ncbi:MAG: phospholipase A, partial [bacterium]
FFFLSCFFILVLMLPAFAQEEEKAQEQPLPETAAPAEVSVEEIPALDRRLETEEKVHANAFAITPHRPNYFLFLTYNSSPNNAAYAQAGGDLVDEYEVKFQLSLKILLWEHLFENNGHFYFAYTQLSFWQLYNKALSSPFRETNYEPELMLAFDTNYTVLGLKNRLLTVSLDHQSNGRTEPLSRSWNRVYAQFLLERGNFVLSLKPWYRIPEDEAHDDNPDIYEYLGYGEVHAFYHWKNSVFGVMLRNNLRWEHNRGAVQLDWSFPLTSKLKGYIQYFNGYGESLIDYNHSVNRIGIGFMFTDWL